jgi:uncharacterized protein (UPF0305 family)
VAKKNVTKRPASKVTLSGAAFAKMVKDLVKNADVLGSCIDARFEQLKPRLVTEIISGLESKINEAVTQLKSVLVDPEGKSRILDAIAELKKQAEQIAIDPAVANRFVAAVTQIINKLRVFIEAGQVFPPSKTTPASGTVKKS